jgi:DNA-directed RNA polymerase specialized sigma24 family protein
MGTDRRDAAAFEAFYKDVRSRLLLQTWALTGDLGAAHKGVQDALIIAWHHWRKVRRLPSDAARENYVRPIAWAHGLRRRSVPRLHRDKAVDEESRATLDALARLPLAERKVLLLAFLTTLSAEEIAREAGITPVRAEQELKTATSSFTLYRGVLPTDVLSHFEPLAATVATTRWPRPTILTRAGSARRRTHTLVGAVAAVAAFAGSGFAVTATNGDRPSLGSLSLRHGSDGSPTGASRTPYPLTATTLLEPSEVAGGLGGSWTTSLTSDDAAAVTLPCHRGALADAHPRAALVRTFVGPKKSITAGQTTLASTTTTAASAAYAKTLSWYGGCSDPQVQLLSTERIAGVGDQAALLLLRDWADPQRTIAVGVARSGVLTTTVAGTLPVADPAGKGDRPVIAATTGLLGDAVQQLCRLPGAGTCVGTAAGSPAPPPASGEHPELLNESDLPPVDGVTEPWVGTAPAVATTNVAATRCDQTSFTGPGITRAMTRSFVIPTATGLAPQFGLTETVGGFASAKAAAAFVDDIRGKLAACQKTDLGSHVTRLSTAATGGRDVTAWRVRVETSQTSSVVYLMAIVRNGSAVGQVGFVPSGSTTMADAAFTTLADRAADRLGYLR